MTEEISYNTMEKLRSEYPQLLVVEKQWLL